MRTLQKIQLRLKTLFSIEFERHDTVNSTLLLELGQDYCNYGFFNEQAKSFVLIRYISFDEFETTESLSQIFAELKNTHFEKVIFCIACFQALVIPHKYVGNAQALLNAIYEAPEQKYLNDAIAEWQIAVSYSIPLPVHQLITEAFPSAQFFHAYTPAIKIYNGFVADQISIHFTQQHFRIFVKKGQQLQLAQTYFYKTPLDVIYYLLKITTEFEMENAEIVLIISGLVDEKSAMYDELHNYFLNLHFALPPAFTLPESAYPQHFFTSLYNLAACVS